MKASDLFVKALENENVEVIFGIPGEENLDLIESLSKSEIKFVLCRHEQAAAFMAATFGRLKEKAGVCLSTLGPGATNLMTGAAHSQLAGFSMVMITGQKPVKSSKQANFQILDVVEMLEPITKNTMSLISGKAIPFEVRRAFRISEFERRGVTHIELPEDISQEEVDKDELLHRRDIYQEIAPQEQLINLCKLIKETNCPIIVIGSEANRKSCCHIIEKLVNNFGIPFITTQMGKGVVDELNENYIGNATVSSGSLVHEALRQSDLIINIGYNDVEKPPFLMPEMNAKVVHLSYTPAKITELYYPDFEIIGDIFHSVENIIENIAKGNWEFDKIRQIQQKHLENISEKLEDEGFPIIPQRLVGSVQKILPDNAIVCLDNGMYKLWFARYFRSRHSKNLLLDNALATMGAGLPSAIAAKYLFPEKKVIAVCGDGGFMMNAQELETASRLNLDLVVIIVEDSEMGMIRWKQEHDGFNDYALDFNNPDFEKLAEAYGEKGYKIGSADDLDETLAKCLNEKGIHLISVPINYEGNYVFEAMIEGELKEPVN